MVVDDTKSRTGSGRSDATDETSTIGRSVRVALATCAVLLGIVWTVRIALDGDVSSGVLLQLLPPLALIYLGVRYFRSIVGATGSDSS